MLLWPTAPAAVNQCIEYCVYFSEGPAMTLLMNSEKQNSRHFVAIRLQSLFCYSILERTTEWTDSTIKRWRQWKTSLSRFDVRFSRLPVEILLMPNLHIWCFHPDLHPCPSAWVWYQRQHPSNARLQCNAKLLWQYHAVRMRTRDNKTEAVQRRNVVLNFHKGALVLFVLVSGYTCARLSWIGLLSFQVHVRYYVKLFYRIVQYILVQGAAKQSSTAEGQGSDPVTHLKFDPRPITSYTRVEHEHKANAYSFIKTTKKNEQFTWITPSVCFS